MNIQLHSEAKTVQIEYVVIAVSGNCKFKKLSIKIASNLDKTEVEIISLSSVKF